MLQQTSSPKRWDTRRQEKQARIERLGLKGKVLPTDDLPAMLEKLIAPGDRVVLEGNNQKQADFLSRMLSQTSPDKLHDLHMIMPSVSLPEHLDLFEKGIARKIDFSYSGAQSRVCRSCWKTACLKSARSIPISSCIPACTSI